MSWNYRVVCRKFPNDEYIYNIHEAYYEDGSDTPHSITTNPCYPEGDSTEELKKDIERFMKAFSRPVLEYDNFNSDKPYEDPWDIGSKIKKK